MFISTSEGEAACKIKNLYNAGIKILRPPRSRMPWIWGGPGLGKSVAAMQFLEQFKLRICDMSTNGWDDNFANSDERYDIIRWNEYAGQIPIEKLKQIAGGERVNLNVRYQGDFLMDSDYRPFVIIVAQHPPEHYYRIGEKHCGSVITEDDIGALYDRFEVIHVTEPFPATVFPVPGLVDVRADMQESFITYLNRKHANDTVVQEAGPVSNKFHWNGIEMEDEEPHFQFGVEQEEIEQEEGEFEEGEFEEEEEHSLEDMGIQPQLHRPYRPPPPRS